MFFSLKYFFYAVLSEKVFLKFQMFHFSLGSDQISLMTEENIHYNRNCVCVHACIEELWYST